MLGNLGFTEIAILLLILVLFFGAKRIPEIGASIGKGIREFKRGLSSKEDAGAEGDEADRPLPPPAAGAGGGGGGGAGGGTEAAARVTPGDGAESHGDPGREGLTFADLSFAHILIVLLVLMLVFGARRIPEIGASLGQGIREFKRGLRAEEPTARAPEPPTGEPKRLSQ